MKIVVIGGTGLIGTKLVSMLAEQGHEAIAASPNTGVNTVTEQGMAEALSGAQVIVDVSNPPSFEDQEVLDFFTTSTRNLLRFGAMEGIGHMVALSVVGGEKLPDSVYLRGKVAQERLIEGGPLPCSIIHATQFFEFIKPIADGSMKEGRVHLSPAFVQPIAADDVAKAIARISVGPPIADTVEIAGPDKVRLADIARHCLKTIGDPREVVADPDAPYFGAHLNENSLVPGVTATLWATTFDEWLSQGNLKR